MACYRDFIGFIFCISNGNTIFLKINDETRDRKELDRKGQVIFACFVT